MTKKELIKALEVIGDDDVVVCMNRDGGWDNIERVDPKEKAIVWGGGSPFTDGG